MYRVGASINEVCLLFDVDVLVDIANDSIAMCDGVPLQVRVALGADGMRSLMTRWFASEEELDEFCQLNINRFRIAARQPIVPDATEWR